MKKGPEGPPKQNPPELSEFLEQIDLRGETVKALRKFNEGGGEKEKQRAIKLVKRWQEQEMTKRDSSRRGNIDFCIGCAELYHEAGMPDSAVEYYRQALAEAVNNRDQKAYDLIVRRLDGLGLSIDSKRGLYY